MVRNKRRTTKRNIMTHIKKSLRSGTRSFVSPRKNRPQTQPRLTGSDVSILTIEEQSNLERMRAEQRRITSTPKNSIEFLKAIGVITEDDKFSENFTFAT